MKKYKKSVVFLAIVVALIIGFFLLQLIPYGKSHTNPPVVQEPNWDSPTTRVLAQRACFDCHSNETGWPWYSSIAPVSWLIQRDVDEGRQKLNFSEWQNAARFRHLNEIGEIINSGEMPPLQYYPMHPNARLTDTEKQALITGLQTTLK